MRFTKFGSSEAYGFLALLPCSLATIGAVFSLSFATSFCGAPIARCRRIRLGLQYGVIDRQSYISKIANAKVCLPSALITNWSILSLSSRCTLFNNMSCITSASRGNPKISFSRFDQSSGSDARPYGVNFDIINDPITSSEYT